MSSVMVYWPGLEILATATFERRFFNGRADKDTTRRSKVHLSLASILHIFTLKNLKQSIFGTNNRFREQALGNHAMQYFASFPYHCHE